MFVSLFVCTLYKFTFLNRSQPNFAHVSPIVWNRGYVWSENVWPFSFWPSS